MRRLRAVFVGAVAVATAAIAVVPLGAGAQEAATVAEVGWWSQNPTAAPPQGGFQVAQGPNGDISVSAVRIRVDAPSLTAARLILDDSQVVGTPTLQLCPTASTWSASSHAFAEAPQPECASPLALQRDEAAGTFFADVAALLGAGGDVSLMVVPAPDPANPTPVRVPFQVDFAGASIVASAPEPSTETTSGSGGGGEVASTDLGSLPVDTGLNVAPSAPGADLSFSPVAAPPDLNPAAAPAAAAPPQVPGRFPVRTVAKGDNGADTPWGRLPLVILGAAVFGAVAAVARQRLQSIGWLPSG